MARILAIESSCDETAASVISDGQLLSNIVSTQIDVHRKYGGVMPDAVAVTRGPGLIGALHVGLQAAKTIAMLYKIPLIPVHHLAGHIYANEYVSTFKFPMLAVVVSGGNTELVLMKDHLDFEILAKTRDDAIGECYDKVARVLGLPYPGGIPIDKLAKVGKHSYDLPIPLRGEKTLDLSYSGLKTNVINLVHNLEQKGEKVNVEDMCKSFQDVAVGLVIDRTIKVVKEHKVNQVILAGGVSANSYLREQMTIEMNKLGVEINIPPMWCCTDNAAMIAKVAERLYDLKVFAPLDISVDPNWEIDEWNKF